MGFLKIGRFQISIVRAWGWEPEHRRRCRHTVADKGRYGIHSSWGKPDVRASAVGRNGPPLGEVVGRCQSERTGGCCCRVIYWFRARLYGVLNYDMAISDTLERTYVLERDCGVCVGNRTYSDMLLPVSEPGVCLIGIPYSRAMGGVIYWLQCRLSSRGPARLTGVLPFAS